MRRSTEYADFEIVFYNVFIAMLQILFITVILTAWALEYDAAHAFRCNLYVLVPPAFYCGLWLLHQTCITRMYFDVRAGSLTLVVRKMFTMTRRQLSFDEVSAVDIEQYPSRISVDPEMVALGFSGQSAGGESLERIILTIQDESLAFPVNARILSRRSADGRPDNPALFRWTKADASASVLANSVAEGLVQILGLEPEPGAKPEVA